MKVTENKSSTATIQKKSEPFFRREGSQDFFSQKTGGNTFFSPSKSVAGVQAKLTIGQPGDKYEQEADATADKVVQRLASPESRQREQGIQRKPLAAGISPLVRKSSNDSIGPSLVQAKCAACEKEEKLQKKEEKKDEEGKKEKLQRKPIFDSDAEPPEDKAVQRKCAACEEEERRQVQQQHDQGGVHLQRKDDGQLPGNLLVQRQPGFGQEEYAGDAIENRLNASKGAGTPLPEETRKQMESSMGADFSGVRIHSDGQAADMSRDMNAQAFTYGNDIYFNDGKYNTNTQSGQHLLAHELTHVIQQNGSDVMKKPQDREEKEEYLEARQSTVQRKWYNFSIPFTDYEFDPSIEGLKTAGGLAKDAAVWTGNKVKEGATYVKDKAVEVFEWVVDRISELVSEGVEWLKGKFNEIIEFGNTVFDKIKNGIHDVISLITGPINLISQAMENMSVDTLQVAWNLLKTGANTVWNAIKNIVNGVLSFGNGIWNAVSGGIDSIFGKVQYLMDSWTFNKLPDLLVNKAKGIFSGIKKLWETVRNYWTNLWTKITAFIQELLESVENFVNKIISFAIDTVIATVKKLKEIYDAVKMIVDDPVAAVQPYLDIITAKINAEAPGKSQEVASEKISEYFGNKQAFNPSGVVQKAPGSGPARSTESRDDVDTKLTKELEEQWGKLSIGTMLKESFYTMFWPPDTIKAIGHEFYELWNADWANAANSLYAPSFDSIGLFFHDVWTNILILCDFPFKLLLRLENVLMMLMGYVTIILVIIGFCFAGVGALGGLALAGQIGEALFFAYLLTESAYCLKLFADLYTARQTEEEKKRDYRDISGGVIGLGIGIVMMVIFAIIAALIKLVVAEIRGPQTKAEPPKTAEGEPKTDAKTEIPKTGEAPKLEGEVASLDGQRSVNITEKGKVWICASPCEQISLKYEAEIKGNPKFEERIKALEDGYDKLNAEQKAVRDTQIKQLEQELADIKAQKDGKASSTVPKELTVGEEVTIPYGDGRPVRAKVVSIENGMVKFEYVTEIGSKNVALSRTVKMEVFKEWLKEGNAIRWLEGRDLLMKNRPPYEPGLVEKIWEKAKGADGKVRDPNPPFEELSWDKSKSRFDQWHMGHKPGKEYFKLVDEYVNGKITYDEFIKEYNNPENYQPELPSKNVGHQFEQK